MTKSLFDNQVWKHINLTKLCKKGFLQSLVKKNVCVWFILILEWGIYREMVMVGDVKSFIVLLKTVIYNSFDVRI